MPALFLRLRYNAVLRVLLHAGADGPETEAGGGAGEAAGGAGALQEVFDAATDTLASKQPLQGLPAQVTPTLLTNRPPGPLDTAHFWPTD